MNKHRKDTKSKAARRILAVALTIMTVVAYMPVMLQTAYATDSGSDIRDGHAFVPGHIAADVDIKYVGKSANNLKTQGSHAEKHDPRTESWFQNNAIVKDQRSTGLCWAFSTTTAAELSYAYNHKDDGKCIEELSPTHLGYFFFNRQTDPLGNTYGDTNYYTWRKDWAGIGGDAVYTFQDMATWAGLATEETAPFNRDYPQSQYATSSYSSEIAYNDSLILKSNSYYKSCTVDTLKSVIEKYGAAVISMDYEDGTPDNGEAMPNYFSKSGDRMSFYNHTASNGDSNNHEVTLIGWDDNYSKDNFGSNDADDPDTRADESSTTYKPSSDGAWIIQNSWGSSWGENGCFYASYESKDILNGGTSAFEMVEDDTYDYNFQYDGNANNSSINLSAGAKAANVFTAPSSDRVSISTVAFTTWNQGSTSYDIDVYTDLTEDDDPTSGTKAASKTVTTTTAGFKSFDLDEPVTVQPGKKFSVVVTMNNATLFGIEQSDRYYFTAANGTGDSFQLYGNSWEDMYNQYYCFRIKAFATEDDRPEIGDVSIENTAYEYTGEAITPEVTVKDPADGTKNLVINQDYEVSYANNINAGTATITVSGIGNYSGNRTVTFSINQRNISNAEITFSRENFYYTGYQIKPPVTVTDPDLADSELEEGTDYTVSYSDNISAGSAKVTVTGKGNYQGTKEKIYEILETCSDPAELGSAAITGATSYTYTGNAITPEIEVKNAAGETLIEGMDYTVEYANNTSAGTATITVTGVGSYTGTKTISFTINSSGGSSGGTTGGGTTGGGTTGGGTTGSGTTGGGTTGEQPEEPVINIEVTDGKAEAEIDDKTAEQIISNAEKNESEEISIVAKVDSTKDVNESELTFPASIASAAGSSGARLTIETSTAIISLDADAVRTIADADAENIRLNIDRSSESTDRKGVYDINLVTIKGDESTPVHDMNGTAQFTVPLPSGLTEADNPTGACINGEYAESIPTECDKTGARLTLHHFSTYAVMSETDADALFESSAEATTMGKLTLKAYKNGKIKASWATGEGNTDSIVSYQVYRSTDKKFKKKVEKYTVEASGGSDVGTSAITTCTMSKNLKKGKRYYVKVRANIELNGKTYKSQWTATKSIKCRKTR